MYNIISLFIHKINIQLFEHTIYFKLKLELEGMNLIRNNIYFHDIFCSTHIPLRRNKI